MGSEDLFHKRKARSAKHSERRQASRKPYERVLIVCEGEKTEPIYFEEARIYWDLDSANVEIDGTCSSSSRSVVNHAQVLYDTELRSGDSYDRVFCIFDRDAHTTYDEAITKVTTINNKLIKEKLTKQPVFTAIHSDPAFEYWLLLHFTPSTKPYKPSARKSIGDQVIDDLKQYMPDYKKTLKGIFKSFHKNGSLQTAKAHCKRLYQAAQKNNNMNPSCNMFEIIEYLENLKHNT